MRSGVIKGNDRGRDRPREKIRGIEIREAKGMKE